MPRYRLGDVVHDLTTRTLVMGILNRTPDSFYDAGETFELDALVRRAGQLVDAGRRPPRHRRREGRARARGGRGRGARSGDPVDRGACTARFDVPISCDTWRASVLDAACAAGAVVGNDISGFADPDYLARRGEARRVRRRDPHPARSRGSPIPSRTTTTSSPTSATSSSTGRERAEAAGLAAEQIAIDAGLDLGKTPAMSAVLLRESDVARRPRLHAAALGVQQALPRRAARPRHRRPARASRSPRSRTASRTGAGSCGSTTSAGPSTSAGSIEAILEHQRMEVGT